MARITTTPWLIHGMLRRCGSPAGRSRRGAQQQAPIPNQQILLPLPTCANTRSRLAAAATAAAAQAGATAPAATPEPRARRRRMWQASTMWQSSTESHTPRWHPTQTAQTCSSRAQGPAPCARARPLCFLSAHTQHGVVLALVLPRQPPEQLSLSAHVRALELWTTGGVGPALRSTS